MAATIDSAIFARGRLAARPSPNVRASPLPQNGLEPLRLDGRGRDGLLYVPPSYDPQRASPLLVMLHGAGAEAANVMSMIMPHADARRLIVLAPDSRGSTWDAIRGGYGPDVAFIDHALRKTFASYRIATGRIAIGGFSDGASYGISLGLINSDLFTHVLAFSPGFAPFTGPRDTPQFFVTHGVHDTVLPIAACSRRLVPQLRRAGFSVEYREFEGGHAVPPAIADEAIAWFLDGDRDLRLTTA